MSKQNIKHVISILFIAFVGSACDQSYGLKLSPGSQVQSNGAQPNSGGVVAGSPGGSNPSNPANVSPTDPNPNPDPVIPSGPGLVVPDPNPSVAPVLSPVPAVIPPNEPPAEQPPVVSPSPSAQPPVVSNPPAPPVAPPVVSPSPSAQPPVVSNPPVLPPVSISNPPVSPPGKPSCVCKGKAHDHDDVDSDDKDKDKDKKDKDKKDKDDGLDLDFDRDHGKAKDRCHEKSKGHDWDDRDDDGEDEDENGKCVCEKSDAKGHLILNVKVAEISEQQAKGHGVSKRLFDQNLGKVSLYSEAPKLLKDAAPVVGSDVMEVRLQLNDTGNAVVDDNGNVLCVVSIPSGDLKIQFDHFTVHDGVSYSLQVTDDFYHPVSDHCILRPVAHAVVNQK